MIHNVRVYVEHVRTEDNTLADHLSRIRIREFTKEERKMKVKCLGKDADLPENLLDKFPTPIPDTIWPPSKIWMN